MVSGHWRCPIRSPAGETVIRVFSDTLAIRTSPNKWLARVSAPESCCGLAGTNGNDQHKAGGYDGSSARQLIRFWQKVYQLLEQFV